MRDIQREWQLQLEPPADLGWRGPLTVTVSHDGRRYQMWEAGFLVYGFGKTPTEAARQFWRSLGDLINDFDECPPEVLSPNGREFRERLAQHLDR